jgi:menaquinone-dependent protoporphyrinogen oxidase
MLSRVLVTYGSKRGGTAGIAAALAATLSERGFDVDCVRASAVRNLGAYDAVIIGGALYAGRWIREARRFVVQHAAELRARPVWMFSSGPLDDTANRRQLPAVPRVAALMARIRARGHAMFGGRLAPDATGFPASVMAKTHAGDWRAWDQIRAWGRQVADEIARAPRPTGAVEEPPARGLLAALCFTVGIASVAGGAALLASPDGSLLRLPHRLLAQLPFASFVVPGLVLALVLGVGNLIAGALVVRCSPRANAAALAAGIAVLVWIVVELVVGLAHPMQLIAVLVGFAIMTEALRRRTGAAVPPGAGRPLSGSAA